MFEVIVNVFYPQVLHGGSARINELWESMVRRWPNSSLHDLETALSLRGGRRHFALLASWRAALAHIHRSPNPCVLIHYPNVPSAYPFSWKKLVAALIWFPFLCALLKHWGKTFVLSVEDLPLLQHRDLAYALPIPKPFLRHWERIIFKSADELWFASKTMADIQIARLGLGHKFIRVVVNGCPSIHSARPLKHTSSGVRFVYAGTLSKSRGLSYLLSAFGSVPGTNSELHLCGIEGQWIKGEIHDPRVYYYGALSSKAAARMVRHCDVGIIPYPERGYFQVAYPVKLSLYIVSGLGILSTSLSESRRVIEAENVGIVVLQKDLGTYMSWIAANPEIVLGWKNKAQKAASHFTWDGILEDALTGYTTAKLRVKYS